MIFRDYPEILKNSLTPKKFHFGRPIFINQHILSKSKSNDVRKKGWLSGQELGSDALDAVSSIPPPDSLLLFQKESHLNVKRYSWICFSFFIYLFPNYYPEIFSYIASIPRNKQILFFLAHKTLSRRKKNQMERTSPVRQPRQYITPTACELNLCTLSQAENLITKCILSIFN